MNYYSPVTARNSENVLVTPLHRSRIDARARRCGTISAVGRDLGIYRALAATSPGNFINGFDGCYTSGRPARIGALANYLEGT